VLPYSLTATALKPAIHVGAVIGEEIPIWDIRDHFGETDMLVRTMEQARNMTVAMGANSCLLMRGHGAVIAGRSLKEAVMIAVYLQVNAQVQTIVRDTILSSRHGSSLGIFLCSCWCRCCLTGFRLSYIFQSNPCS
jgi:ribulose-5-phosphate 4-epimerase/fuculose-1-phosphate aldolase